ncbi:MAG: mitochondrial 37S ribosomal protein rsm10 [Vezdaea aestivalis]|nr:MAG: mitochondrial 37S ribosomal protein rsm10 [Vezdaea aestivalis]
MTSCSGRALCRGGSRLAKTTHPLENLRSFHFTYSKQTVKSNRRPLSQCTAYRREPSVEKQELVPRGALAEGDEEAKQDDEDSDKLRLPRSVQALYLKPLRRKPTHGIPCCDLQLRSYEVRNVEFFADFAMRAAYYLNLPALGPIPLPRMISRWTVPKSNFVHKKAQENFERVTLRRLIQIQDGHEDAIKVWLAFLRRHQYHGVGLKANLWRHSKLDVSGEMDLQVEKFTPLLDPIWDQLVRRKGTEDSNDLAEYLSSDRYRARSKLVRPVAR